MLGIFVCRICSHRCERPVLPDRYLLNEECPGCGFFALDEQSPEELAEEEGGDEGGEEVASPW